MKSKMQKRKEAAARAANYTFENSKICRKAKAEKLPNEDWAFLRAIWEDKKEEATKVGK